MLHTSSSSRACAAVPRSYAPIHRRRRTVATAPRRLGLACFVTNAPVTISVLTEVIGLLVHGFFFLSLFFLTATPACFCAAHPFFYLVRRVQHVPIIMD